MLTIFLNSQSPLNVNVTLFIIIITCIFSYFAEENIDFKRKYIFNPFLVQKRKEFYRLFSSGFVHGDYMHLAFNMLALYSFGGVLERVFHSLFGFEVGTLLYVLLYISALAVAHLPTLYRHQNNIAYNSLGASGAVSAVVFAVILFLPLLGVGIIFLPIQVPGFIFGLLYLAYSSYMAQYGNDNIGHEAHFWGAVYGMIFITLAYPQVIPNFIGQISKYLG